MKKLSKIVMSLLILVALCFTFTAEAATLGEGEVYANKTAKVVEGGNGRDVDITISLGGESFSHTTSQKREVVLVLDNSGSMNDMIPGPNGTEISKLDALKSATNDLLDTLLPDGVTNDTKVGIVYYSRRATKMDLTNNKASLKSFVNSMSAYGGTNVQEGLKLGNSLFSKNDVNNPANNPSKSLILLSDGEPTFYTTDSGKVVGSGSDDQQACELEFFVCLEPGVKPSEAALTEAKNIDATIYSIGFGVNSNAESFLKKVSGASRYYGANSLDSLKQAFTDITDKIDVIATDVLITDNVPKTFDIDRNYFISTFGEEVKIDDYTVRYGNVTVKTNGDGSKTVTKAVGNLKAGADNDFTFRVKAKDDYYGNMFTNGNASVTGVAVDDNPFYIESKSIEIALEKPTVTIPAVTKDDKYSVGQGESISGDVRGNDHKSVQKDKNAKVVDEVLVVTGVSKGSLTFGKDGKFTYVAPKDYVGDVEFTYYIKTTVEVDGKTYEVNSNVSTVTITINKIPTKYVVHYYAEGTTDNLAADYNGDGFVYETINAEAKDIANYELVGDVTTKTITLGKGENTIIFYYRLKQGGKVTVRYYVNGTTDELKNAKELSGKVTESYNTDDLDNEIADWVLVGKTNNTKGKFTLEEQEVIYYYEKQMGKVVVRYVDEDGNDLLDSIILNGQTSTEYETEEKEIPNWILVEKTNNTKGKFTLEEQEVIYYYEKQMGKVIVRYTDKDGNDLLESIILTGQTSTKYNTKAEEIEGYRLVSVEGNESGEFGSEEGLVTYIYELANDGIGQETTPVINTGVTSSNGALIMLILSSLFTTGLIVFRKKINL